MKTTDKQSKCSKLHAKASSGAVLIAGPEKSPDQQTREGRKEAGITGNTPGVSQPTGVTLRPDLSRKQCKMHSRVDLSGSQHTLL